MDETLEECKASSAGRERLIAVHGNRFLLFCVYQALGSETLSEVQEFATVRTKSVALTRALLAAANAAIAEHFPDAYPGNIFKNQERQAELLKFLGTVLAPDIIKGPQVPAQGQPRADP